MDGCLIQQDKLDVVVQLAGVLFVEKVILNVRGNSKVSHYVGGRPRRGNITITRSYDEEI